MMALRQVASSVRLGARLWTLVRRPGLYEVGGRSLGHAVVIERREIDEVRECIQVISGSGRQRERLRKVEEGVGAA